MKKLLAYRDSNYFNPEDYFIIYTTLEAFYVTKCHWFNGAYYSDEGLKYKMTSVLSVSCAELVGKEIKYKHTTLTGTIGKFLNPESAGIVWKQGDEYKKYGLPSYWPHIKNLESL